MTSAATDTPKHTNRLARETSPYLLQHAHNPVDWYAWGPEAFEAARQAGKPIFLSVGYSTCYWCHVMERESFENEEIAATMNQRFICIKVDREERPDVDDIYMAAVQVFTQITEGRASGGWPMSVFLDPRTLKPFYAGTYYPAEPKLGRPSFPQLLDFVAAAWTEKREAMVEQADRIAALVQQQLQSQSQPQPLDREVVDAAVSTLLGIYDPAEGGFGSAPKFPQPVFLELLMACAWDDEPARAAVLHTLDRMAIGGMHDQIGGGFHRYSTDARWLVPHFEKMLYDNGQLASVYAEAFARTGDAFYSQVLRETLDYVLRELTAAEGGFFSAQDAEVNHREGLNYLWRPQEIRQSLHEAKLDDLIEFAISVYGLDRGPNFQDPHHPDDDAKNVLFLTDRPDAMAKAMGVPIDEFNDRLKRVNAALLAARRERQQPGTDDKILAGWNGLMIAGLADGGRVLGEKRYVDAAGRAASFILQKMRAPAPAPGIGLAPAPAPGIGIGRGLYRSYRAGQAKIEAFLEDDALLIRGLIALHRATGEQAWLGEAAALAADAKNRFWDAAHGGYFDTLADQSDLFVRTSSWHDGAVPGGNGVMLLNLLDLHELTGDQQYWNDAIASLKGASGRVAGNPVGAALAAIALRRVLERDPDALTNPQAAQPAGAPVSIEPVKISLDAQPIRISPAQPASVSLGIQIAPTFHINAHDPSDPRLIGFSVATVSGEGIAIEVDYPHGEVYEGEILIHRGEIAVPLRIRQTGPIKGKPVLIVTYQLCTDEACLAPTTKRLPLDIASE